jgi:DNA-binding NarL/FixJ family response regulator
MHDRFALVHAPALRSGPRFRLSWSTRKSYFCHVTRAVGHPISVVIGEDDFLVREGIRRVLEEDGEEFRVVALCGDFGSLVTTIARVRPNVVVTDIRMPPTHRDEGIRLAAHLRDTQPAVGVVVLSQFAGPSYALQLFERGSEGRAYLLKERISHRAHLFGALREVARGGSVIDPKVVEALITARTRSPSSLTSSLTPREREVLGQIAEGKSNTAIAASLFLTKRGVEKHVNAIFSKLKLPPEQSVSRRVYAALVYLSERPQSLAGPLEGHARHDE